MAELRYDITPENAPRFAADVVETVEDLDGIKLDYSVASLRELDGIIEGFRSDGCQFEDVAATLFSFGCYVGEVCVRHAQGKWRAATQDEIDEVFGVPLVVELPKDMTLNPIGKVIKRLEEGEEHDLQYFYRAWTQ